MDCSTFKPKNGGFRKTCERLGALFRIEETLMTLGIENRALVETYSVGNLVRQQQGVDSDPWLFALVQRDISWDEVRMKGLLDSLILGYPIGSLLLCTATQEVRASAQRKERGTPQDLRNAGDDPQLV